MVTTRDVNTVVVHVLEMGRLIEQKDLFLVSFQSPSLPLLFNHGVFPQEEKQEHELINYSDWRLSCEDLRRWWIV